MDTTLRVSMTLEVTQTLEEKEEQVEEGIPFNNDYLYFSSSSEIEQGNSSAMGKSSSMVNISSSLLKPDKVALKFK